MTLEALSDVIGVSKGHLSRFERGEKSLSLAILMRLADALQSSVAELMGELPAAGRSHISKAEDRAFQKVAGGGYSFAPLSRANDPQLNAFVMEFVADSEVRKPSAAYHAGEEIFFVLEGALEIEIGTDKQVLHEGDYLQFPGSLKHTIQSLRKRSRVLVVVLKR
jgi:transcriptional regulator with XRE-family HTH domain